MSRGCPCCQGRLPPARTGHRPGPRWETLARQLAAPDADGIHRTGAYAPVNFVVKRRQHTQRIGDLALP